MLTRISKKVALVTMLLLLTLVVVFHLLILLQVIPYEIVWAGKLSSINQMYMFETASILINILLITVLLFKGNLIRHPFPERFLNYVLWFFIVVFSLNTLGNLTAKTDFERIVFTPLTLVSAILIWVIVRKKEIRTG